MIGDIIIGDPKDHLITNKYIMRSREHQWTDIPINIIKHSLVQTCISSTFIDGIRTIIQTAGVGAIKPNVALFNIKDYTLSTTTTKLKPPKYANTSIDTPNPSSFNAPDWIDGVEDALLTGMGVILIPGDDYIDWTIKRSGYIDVWWLYDDGGLTVLIP
eukprot:259183_1